jgi:putative spermidine/putrescine transport system permease protein
MAATLARGSTIKRSRLAASLFLLLPLALIIGLAFNLPLLMTAIWSITDLKSGSLTPEYYQAFFGTRIYLTVVWRTLQITFAVSLLCALIGYPLSYWMTTLSPRGQKISIVIIIMSFWVSVLVRTYAWIVILGNAGLVNRGLQYLGITDHPVQFLYGQLGVCIGMINVLLPFLLLPLYAAMLQIDPRLRQIALTMGATSTQFFWRVFFPMTLPALSATFILVFILSLGFYITPAILGGGKVPMIANMLDMLINQFPHWSLAAAMSCVMLALTLGLFAVYQTLRGRVAA